MSNAMQQMPYPELRLLIGGQWRSSSDGRTRTIVNPATGEEIGRYPVATAEDLNDATVAAVAGFRAWSDVTPHKRYLILREAARILASRAEAVSTIMTMEQGKPLAEARAETNISIEVIDWLAEEGRRIYERIVPARAEHVEQRIVRVPVGPVAAFTPWNFPVNQAVRKICAALATGCSIVLKGPEETPASCMALVEAFVDAGVPPGAIGLLFGDPAEISSCLIPHPAIRKLSFTGSISVGKQLAALAGSHMKPSTMELGGHAPVLIFPDADIKRAVDILVAAKFRNAGQVCTSPTRFIVHNAVKVEFTEAFTAAAATIRVGNGLDCDTQMGPLVHERRVSVMESFVAEALQAGATLGTGGNRIGNRGYFFEPTVLIDTPMEARVMNEEPFGPLALINFYDSHDAMIAEANRLPVGLAAYAYTQSAGTIARLRKEVEAGMVSINHQGLGLPEVPFGGIRDSGYGNEGGSEALDAYLVSKYVTTYAPQASLLA